LTCSSSEWCHSRADTKGHHLGYRFGLSRPSVRQRSQSSRLIESSTCLIRRGSVSGRFDTTGQRRFLMHSSHPDRGAPSRAQCGGQSSFTAQGQSHPLFSRRLRRTLDIRPTPRHPVVSIRRIRASGFPIWWSSVLNFRISVSALIHVTPGLEAEAQLQSRQSTTRRGSAEGGERME
jgi:hypothetical protein